MYTTTKYQGKSSTDYYLQASLYRPGVKGSPYPILGNPTIERTVERTNTQTMAPRQRGVAVAPTLANSEDESSSDESTDTSVLQQEDKSTKMKPTSHRTLNVTEADIARDNHDIFNIVALGCVVFTVALNYEYPSLSYTGEYFWAMWSTTVLYFFMDLTWVSVVPICVKSPGVIVKHHIVAMIYLSGPIFMPRFRWLMGSILSVELNTWFLICRRLVYRSNYCPSGYAKVSPIITTTVSILFYTTWLSIRCYLYPHILVIFYHLWRVEVETYGRYLFWELLFVPVHVILCGLNLKWTYDLFKPIVKRWTGTGPKAAVVQNGL